MAEGKDDDPMAEAGKTKRTWLDAMVDAKDFVGDKLVGTKQWLGHTVREAGAHKTSVGTKLGHVFSHTWETATLDPLKQLEAEQKILDDTHKRKTTKHAAMDKMQHERDARQDGIEDREADKKAHRQAREELREAQKGVAEKIEEFKAQYKDEHDGQEPSKREILAERKRLNQEILDKYNAAVEEAKRAREERQKERAEKRGYQPTQPESKAMESLKSCKSYKEAEKVLKESKEARFTLASSTVENGTGEKVWDDPKFPKKQPKDSKLSAEEYEAERRAHQVTYRIENGKVMEIIVGEKANFIAAVQGSLVQKRENETEAERKFGNVEVTVESAGMKGPVLMNEVQEPVVARSGRSGQPVLTGTVSEELTQLRSELEALRTQNTSLQQQLEGKKKEPAQPEATAGTGPTKEQLDAQRAGRPNLFGGNPFAGGAAKLRGTGGPEEKKKSGKDLAGGQSVALDGMADAVAARQERNADVNALVEQRKAERQEELKQTAGRPALRSATERGGKPGEEVVSENPYEAARKKLKPTKTEEKTGVENELGTVVDSQVVSPLPFVGEDVVPQIRETKEERRDQNLRAQLDKLYGKGEWTEEQRTERLEQIQATKQAAKGLAGAGKPEDVGRSTATATAGVGTRQESGKGVGGPA